MTQYARGRRKEWALCKALRAGGLEVVRSAGSHGLWDVAAVGPVNVYLCQVKYSKAKTFTPDANCKKFAKMKVAPNVSKLVYVYYYGRSVPDMICL